MYQKLSTEFYDHSNKLADEAEVELYGQYFTKNQMILEGMCGQGRLLISMLKSGYQVHGVDISHHMLTSCHKQLQKHNLQTALFEQSVVEMNLPYKYDGIILPLASFQILTPREIAYKALDVFHNHLNNDGKLIFDTYIPWVALNESYVEGHAEQEVNIKSDTNIKCITHDKVNKIEQYIIRQNTFIKTIKGKIIETEDESMIINWYYIFELELILKNHGFGNIKWFSSPGHELCIAQKV